MNKSAKGKFEKWAASPRRTSTPYDSREEEPQVEEISGYHLRGQQEALGQEARSSGASQPPEPAIWRAPQRIAMGCVRPQRLPSGDPRTGGGRGDLSTHCYYLWSRSTVTFSSNLVLLRRAEALGSTFCKPNVSTCPSNECLWRP
eukprot:5523305-Prymnesium_polylepis.1